MPDTSRPSLRLFIVLVALAAIVAVATLAWTSRIRSQAQSNKAGNVLSKMLSQGAAKSINGFVLVDADGDMVADLPTAADRIISPDPIVFSYIAELPKEGEDDVADDARRATWQPLLDAIAERTGHGVEFVRFSRTDDQLAAFRRGDVHVAGLNTGGVKAAVEQCGFVPLCALGKADGTYGYTMKIIVPASSNIASLAALRGRKVTFTRPISNSGFKAAFVLLMDQCSMLPERDYQWSFSLDHVRSIQLVSTGQTDAASIASDVLARAIATGQVAADSIRTIYESERFPPATIGIAYNLAPELRDNIQRVLYNFDWKGTALEEELGPMGVTQFVPVNYKDDWANIRRIDARIDDARSSR